MPVVAADASGGRLTCGVRLARSMAASLLTDWDISVDHRYGATDLQHRIGADLRHHALHLRLHLALDLYHHTSDRDAHLVDLDRARSDFELDALHRLVGNLSQIGLRADVAHFDIGGEIAHRHGAVHVAHADSRAVITLADRGRVVARADGHAVVALAHRDRAVALRDRQPVVLLHGDRLVVLNVDGLVVFHRHHAVVVDLDRLVVLHVGGKVLLRLFVDELAALLVIERIFIEVRGPTLQAGPRAEAGLRLVAGRIDRLHLVVVQAAHDDRPIGAAVDKRHRGFRPDARNELRAPGVGGP